VHPHIIVKSVNRKITPSYFFTTGIVNKMIAREAATNSLDTYAEKGEKRRKQQRRTVWGIQRGRRWPQVAHPMGDHP
jgi:hypothetical protein